MGRLVSVSKSGASNVQLPNGHPYNLGDHVVLSNEEFAVINPASYGTDAVLTDGGVFPLVNSIPTGPVVPTLGALDLLNSDTVQVANPQAPARTNLNRYTPTSDVAAALVTAQVVFVPVVLADGDVITNVTFRTGATAAGTPTHGFVALYSKTGALLHQSADFTTTARAANTTYTVALSATYTVPAGAGGVFYVAIGFTATTVPSILAHVLTNAAGTTTSLTAPVVGPTATVPLAQATVGGSYGATAPATIAGATGIVDSLNAPYVILT